MFDSSSNSTCLQWHDLDRRQGHTVSEMVSRTPGRPSGGAYPFRVNGILNGGLSGNVETGRRVKQS